MLRGFSKDSLSKDSLVVSDYAFDVFTWRNAQDSAVLMVNVHAKVKGDRSGALQLEVILLHENANDDG